MKTFWRLLGFAKPVEKFAIPYFFYTLLYAFFNTFNFVLIIPILNTLFDGNKIVSRIDAMPEFKLSTDYLTDLTNYLLYKHYGTNYDVMEILVFLSVAVVVSVLLSNTFRYLGQRTIETMRIYTLRNLRNRTFDNVMNLNVGYFSNERKGDIISKISSDVQVVQFCITNTLQVIFREPFLIIGYLVALIALSWQLTIFTGLFLPVTALVIGGIVKRLRHSARSAQEAYGELTSALDESLTGIKIIKAYNATGYIKQKFHDINQLFSDISLSIARRQQLASPMSEFLGVSTVAIIMIYGGSLVLGGELPAADFLGYIAIFSQITRPARAVTDSLSTINQGLAAGDRVLELLDTRPAIENAPDAKRMDGLHEAIEFRDVHFAYDSREVIGGVSFTVRRGETVALVGPSGGGKSTLADLVPRFYDVTSGAILIDGVNVRQLDLESLHAHIGVVAQETILFNDTIENNIRLGKRDATQAEIEAAARVANAHEFIMETENGYQANIGDRGMKLSGGQRQRLSIARAVLKNPDILILDEATSALDTESEKLVQDALNSLLEGRTSVVIAHRLSTIHNADKIIVIEHGRIAEQGTHHELMALGGIYSKLIEMQQLA
ncbi:MAG: ABC transporter ATP-binding protein [Rikenellaceae bacterium]|nr:ABC transporter ATP-binding protein [Rikenellaceae bacterium]